jgi:hypothetical protein
MTTKRHLQAKDRDDEREIFANSPFKLPILYLVRRAVAFDVIGEVALQCGLVRLHHFRQIAGEEFQAL